jgi:hypothetical protein
MRIVQTAVAAFLMGVVMGPAIGVVLHAQVPSPATPTTQQPGPPVAQPAPAAPQAPVPGAPPVPTAILPPVPAAPILPRSFTAKTGLLFNAVRPERATDFEIVLGLFEDALTKSTDPAVRAQAAGWRVFKATEPGPNATVLYVFVVDPAIPGADYGLGRILSEAYPDRIQEIWKLYTGALAGGGSLLNLSPVEPPPATTDTPTITEPATTASPAGRGATPPRPAPPQP